MRRRPAEADGELRLGEPGREKGGEEVPKNRKLTLDSLVLAMVKEEVGGGGNRARRAVVGAEENRRRRRFRAPRLDSFGGEGEDDEAELLVVVDLRGEAPSGGDVRVTAAGPWRPLRARVRVSVS